VTASKSRSVTAHEISNTNTAVVSAKYNYIDFETWFWFTQDYVTKLNNHTGSNLTFQNSRGLDCVGSTGLISYIVENYIGLPVTGLNQGSHTWCEVYLPDGRFVFCEAGFAPGNVNNQHLPRAFDAILYAANETPLCSWGAGEGIPRNYTYETPSEMEAYIQAHPYN